MLGLGLEMISMYITGLYGLPRRSQMLESVQMTRQTVKEVDKVKSSMGFEIWLRTPSSKANHKTISTSLAKPSIKHLDSPQILRFDATTRAANIPTGNMYTFKQR